MDMKKVNHITFIDHDNVGNRYKSVVNANLDVFFVLFTSVPNKALKNSQLPALKRAGL